MISQVFETTSKVLRFFAECCRCSHLYSDYDYIPEHSLESPESSQTERAIVEMVNLVRKWPSGKMDVTPNLWSHMETWDKFSSRVDRKVHLNSPRAWLRDPPSTVWFNMLSLCAASSQTKDLYAMAFALGILAYRTDFDVHRQLPRSLLAVAVHNFSIPSIASEFQLHLGLHPTQGEVQNLARRHCIPFRNHHQPHLLQQAGETNRSFQSRRKRAHQQECDKQSKSIAVLLMDSWPCPSPPMPPSSEYPLIAMAKLEDVCQSLFSTRYANRCLNEQTLVLQKNWIRSREERINP